VEFNSSTLYRYATVNVDELKHNIGTDTAAAVRAFAEAFIYSMPTGKQNTAANRTVPDMVYITISCDQPVNLVGVKSPSAPLRAVMRKRLRSGLWNTQSRPMKNSHPRLRQLSAPPEVMRFTKLRRT